MALELGYLKGGHENFGFSILNYVARSLQSAVASSFTLLFGSSP